MLRFTAAAAVVELLILCGVWSSVNYLSSSQDVLIQDRVLSNLRYDVTPARVTGNAQQSSIAAAVPVMQPTPNAQQQQETHELPHSRFAYVFYATSDIYACSVLVNIHRLRHELNSSLPIHVLVSPGLSESFIRTMENTGAAVHLRDPPRPPDNDVGYYQDCFLKLLAFQMHEMVPELKRVLVFDSDQLIMKNLDHLFTGLPDVDLAAPRAYWLAKDFVSSTFMLITLSDRLWSSVSKGLDHLGTNKFDMDLVNEVLGETVMTLSGEYATLNSHWESWGLPSWYHAVHKINMTTVKVLNKLAQLNLQSDVAPIQARSLSDTPESTSIAASRTSTYADLASSAVSRYTDTPPRTSDPVSSAPPAIPTPRFPETHPLTLELYRLQDAASVIHFTALGKPWTYSANEVIRHRPDAHPLMAAQFHMWRETAARVCPTDIRMMYR